VARLHVATVLGAAALLLSGCTDFTIVVTTPTPTPNTITLPPIGFNHRYGNSPVASADGFALERRLFAARTFWEVAIQADPERAGYVDASNTNAVTAARHATNHVMLVIATELRDTMEGLLANATDAGQEAYSVAMLDQVRAFGYDSLASAEVVVFFTEADLHSKLSWTARGGYSFKVNDNNLLGTPLNPPPKPYSPLPIPVTPAASP
jgi:hypothetical protein